MPRHDEQQYYVDIFASSGKVDCDLEADQKRYDKLEYDLYRIANDLSNTCKDMNKVQAGTSTHFRMPMELLYEIYGLAANAIDKHSIVTREKIHDDV